MVEILLMGTFHFMEHDIDYYAEEAQKELWEINKKLLEFNPDAIAIEASINAQADIDESYKKFSLNDLSDYKKMNSETLGMISMYGGRYPIQYCNEAIQIAYRLGKVNKNDKIYAIDDDTGLNDIPEGETSEDIGAKIGHHLEKMKISSGNISDMLKRINSKEWSYHNKQLYILNNAIGAGKSYAGVDYVVEWYRRNLKIFANLQMICENERYKRVFVLYGAGHLYILRDLIKQCEGMELVDFVL